VPVNSRHYSYTLACKRWDLVRSIVDNNAMHLLPKIDIDDEARSKAYKESGILTNFTSLTKNGLLGLVFRKPAELSIPNEISYIEDDITGSGMSLTQLAMHTVGNNLETGRCGLLVDYPQIDDDTSQADREAKGLKSRIKFYPAESIINWNVKELGSRIVLSLVVLEEIYQELGEDGFEWEERVKHRVLRLDENDTYRQEIWDNNGNLSSIIYPKNADGEEWKEIPFQFIGSENNDADIDTIPLYDIAVVNLGHYRNSCDYEESIFLCGQPTRFLQVKADEFEAAYPGGIKYGSHATYCIGEGGNVIQIQADPNSLVSQAMREKREEAAAIGARLIAEPGGRETAEGAYIRYESQHSALYTLTMNCSLAITKALKWVYLNQTKKRDRSFNIDKIAYKLNSQFYDRTIDPNLLTAMMQGLDVYITAEEIRDYVRDHGGLNLNNTIPLKRLPNGVAEQPPKGAPEEQKTNSPEDIPDDRRNIQQ
jgi:hypothetical protein